MTRSTFEACPVVLAMTMTMAMLAACGDDDDKTPTEIIVEIDAEPGVRAVAESLTVVVEGSDGVDQLTGRVERLSESVKPIEFPKRVAIVPLRGDDERAFVLTATALDGDRKFVAEARIVSGYVPNAVRYAKLLLEDACIHVDSCDELQTCSDATCVDARVDASRLSEDHEAPTDVRPLFGSGGGDGGLDGSTGGAGSDGSTGGVDAGADAATSDAAVPDSGAADAAGEEECKRGFELVGGKCKDVDECEDDNGGCDEAADCTNEPGTFSCECPEGYTGDGETCEPSLISLGLSAGALSPSFDETELDYDVDLWIAAATLDITPTAADGVTIEVNGAELDSGDAWTTPTLPFDGSIEVTIAVSRAGYETREYTLTISRGLQQAYIKGSNTEAGDALGVSLALSADGDTLAVGTTDEDSNGVGPDPDPSTQSDNSLTSSGAVYVFTRSGSTWMQQAYLKASNTGSVDWFGESVALSADGSTLAVGADNEASNGIGVNGPQQSNDSVSGAGAVYVFRRTSGTWSQEAYVKAANTNTNDAFGFAVALSGDGNTLAAGAYGEQSNGSSGFDNSAPYAGAAYVYTRSGNMWTYQTYIKASDAATNQQFGIALALSGNGDLLVVGANQRNTYTGAAYVFERSSSTWTERQIVTASNGEAQDNFGCAVQLSSSGDTLAVAARGEAGPANGTSAAGAVYVYTRAGNVWGSEQIIRASNAEASDGFGRRAALSASGDVLAVAAGGEDGSAMGIASVPVGNNGALGSGAVYVYTRTGGAWTERAYVKASNAEASDAFGQNGLALSGDGTTIAVATQLEDASGVGVNASIQTDNSASNSGAVYVFR